jgi:Protein of unknown function
MDRNRAVKIAGHLKKAGVSLNSALKAALDKDQEKLLKLQIGELIAALHFDILPQVYDRHPDLRPPPEKPRISSTLRWSKVKLPPSVSEKEIDAIIFSELNRQWRKVAMVVGRAFDRCEERGLPIPRKGRYEIFGARLRELADKDLIEGAGDLRKWRFSEVRLKR